MMYWIVFALFMAVETFTDIFISWYGHRGSVGCGEGLALPGLAPWWTLPLCSPRFPFYYEIKMAFVLWLLSPYTRGASMLYRKFVHPSLSRHEKVPQGEAGWAA